VSTGILQGPYAVGDDLRRFWSLTYTIAFTEWKLRFFGSVLGYLWTLVRPLLLFGVIYVVFVEVLSVSTARFYAAYLLTALVLWTYFAEASSYAVSSLVAHESLLRKMRFPRLVIPLSVSLSGLFNLAGNFLAVLVFVLITGVTPRLSWLEMPVLVGLLAMFVTGIGMLLSALYVRYRDVAPIWEVLLQALFYGTPTLWVITQLPESWRDVALCNPVAAIFTQMRHAFIDPEAPNILEAMSSGALVLVPIAVIVGVFALGLAVFSRETPRIAEHL
jgi:ABC-2 type transport system permease protein